MPTTLPFSFPVIAHYGDGSLALCISEEALGLCSEEDAREGFVPEVEIYASSGRAMRPVGIAAIHPTGRSLFGKCLVSTSFEFGEAREFTFDELRAVVRSVIEQDREIWTQSIGDRELLALIDSSVDFDGIAAGLATALGARAANL